MGETSQKNRREIEAQWTARLRTPASTPRIAAMAADAGLSCLFWSIVSATGLPFAEMALPAGLEDNPLPIQLVTFRGTSESEVLARAAAAFRSRAIREFAGASGLPLTVRLYLPWFCVLPSVEARATPLLQDLARAAMPPGRLIVEVETPEASELGALARRVSRFREAGVQVALRAEEPSDLAAEACQKVAPDYLHIARSPRGFDEARVVRAFLERATRGRLRTIVGGVASAVDSEHADALGVGLVYGDAIAAPRFLC